MSASRLIFRRAAASAFNQPTSLSTRSSGFRPLLTHFVQIPNACQSIATPCAIRAYATARGGRPKKSPTTSNKKKAAPKNKKPAAKKKPQARKKPARTPAKKPAKKRIVRKKTEGQLIASKVTALRKVALLDTPKLRPTTVWTLYNSTHVTKGRSAAFSSRENGRHYKNMSASEKESLNQTAINNRALNARSQGEWIRSHSADQIRLANNARTRLNRLSIQRHPGSGVRYTRRYSLLKDDRQLRRPLSGYMQYVADRWATGEFAGVSVGEAGKTFKQEWANLSQPDKKKYNDDAIVRREQYLTESAELYPSIAERQRKTREAADRRATRDRSETLGR